MVDDRDFRLNGVLPGPDVPLVDLKTGRMVEEWRRRAEAEHSALFGPDGSQDVTLDIPSGSYVGGVAEASPSRGLTVGGTPGPSYTVTLQLPQDLRSSATVEFANITCPGNVDGRDVSADGVKLDLIEAEATKNATDAALRARSSHTGTQGWGTITGTPTTLAGYGITDGATDGELASGLAGKSDTGHGHAIADVTGLQSALDGKVGTTSIAAISTDMSGDAFADELKSKLNEVISALG